MKIYFIQGVWFEERRGLDIAYDHTGAVSIVRTVIGPVMYAGSFGQDPENPEIIMGSMTDEVGASELTNIKLTEKKFTFTKRYDDKRYPIHYTFYKQDDGTWKGRYWGQTTGKGQSKCILTQVTESFFVKDWPRPPVTKEVFKSVEKRITSVIDAREEFEAMGRSIIDGFRFNHVVFEYVFSQKPGFTDRICKIGNATEDNVSLLDGLWALFARHGIALDTNQKIVLFQDFLDD